ncbi:Lrp/AsnC family transcriptional regulator [Erythrobacter sp. HL-111]|uniref:Lrp/AsnC family transcriptional regulator n=1 Tax=Erythrobacter sp. HL-111 TaxID=1798193 RepID=UPI0006DAC67C|nr:Lrp/AsnC family transcriptional regulator [Erythrobacter sp. HL-111]KPP91223.1 MAG: AnsC family transcriptional regulator YbaO [Erythrobacteraceae bacterium HL-111]SDT06479.1 Lrp/AsnC family transcriptional regulator [Erythrobacter sp. HL-111]
MTTQTIEIDRIDRKLLAALQADSSLSQRALADKVGLSQNACWRRLNRLQSEGVILGQRAELDLARLGLDLVVVVMIKTPHHSKEWAEGFRNHVERLPGVVDLYRIGGEWDYLIKVVTRGIAGYDRFYQSLVDGFDLSVVTGHFVMEEMMSAKPVALD